MSAQQQVLQLTAEEEKYFRKVFQGLSVKCTSGIDIKTLFKFAIKRCQVSDPALAQFISNQAFSLSQSKNVISKQGFDIFMKYVGQHQSGQDVKTIDIFSKGLSAPLPKLPKTSQASVVQPSPSSAAGGNQIDSQTKQSSVTRNQDDNRNNQSNTNKSNAAISTGNSNNKQMNQQQQQQANNQQFCIVDEEEEKANHNNNLTQPASKLQYPQLPPPAKVDLLAMSIHERPDSKRQSQTQYQSQQQQQQQSKVSQQQSKSPQQQAMADDKIPEMNALLETASFGEVFNNNNNNQRLPQDDNAMIETLENMTSCIDHKMLLNSIHMASQPAEFTDKRKDKNNRNNNSNNNSGDQGQQQQQQSQQPSKIQQNLFQTQQPHSLPSFGKIQIRGNECRKQGILSKSYVVYLIETNNSPNRIERRFNQFQELANYFSQSPALSGRIIPQLPPKEYSISQLYRGGTVDEEFLSQRMSDLEDYLNRITSVAFLEDDEVLRSFLYDTNPQWTVPTQYTKSIIGTMNEMFQNLKNHNFQEHSDYLQAMISQAMGQVAGTAPDFELMDTQNTQRIVKEISAYEGQIQQLQDVTYRQYQLETKKVNRIYAISKNINVNETVIGNNNNNNAGGNSNPNNQGNNGMNNNIASNTLNQSIQSLERSLVMASSQYDHSAKLKKSIWKEFRSIAAQIQAARTAYEKLTEKINKAQLLNLLKAKKYSQLANSPQAREQLMNLDQEIQVSQADISNTKTMLHSELQRFLDSLKAKINEAISTYANQTKREYQIFTA